MQINTIGRYDVIDEEVPNICEIKLRDSGIDVKKNIGEAVTNETKII